MAGADYFMIFLQYPDPWAKDRNFLMKQKSENGSGMWSMPHERRHPDTFSKPNIFPHCLRSLLNNTGVLHTMNGA
jgi:hypothetical protein